MNWREWFAIKVSMPMSEHIRLAKALKVDARHTVELWPFALADVEGRKVIAATDGDTVLIVEHDGTMQADDAIFGEPVDSLNAGDAVRVYTNGLRFCRDWAATGEVPGYAIAGPIASIRHFGAIGSARTLKLDMAKHVGELRTALVRVANIPSVTA